MNRAGIVAWWAACMAHFYRRREIEETEANGAGLVEVSVSPASGAVVLALTVDNRMSIATMSFADADYVAAKLQEAAAESRLQRKIN